MVAIVIFLTIVIIILVLMILYLSAYNKLSEISLKINNSETNIKNLLEEKHKLMKEMEKQIQKVCRKKDYLKDFKEMDKHNYNNHDLDSELAEHFELMLSIQEDHKSLKNDDFNNLVNQIKKIDEHVMANKKFFNKNNNLLIKELKGYYKIVAKYSKINIKTSYDIKKEPLEK